MNVVKPEINNKYMFNQSLNEGLDGINKYTSAVTKVDE